MHRYASKSARLKDSLLVFGRGEAQDFKFQNIRLSNFASSPFPSPTRTPDRAEVRRPIDSRPLSPPTRADGARIDPIRPRTQNLSRRTDYVAAPADAGRSSVLALGRLPTPSRETARIGVRRVRSRAPF